MVVLQRLEDHNIKRLKDMREAGGQAEWDDVVGVAESNKLASR